MAILCKCEKMVYHRVYFNNYIILQTLLCKLNFELNKKIDNFAIILDDIQLQLMWPRFEQIPVR